MLQHVMVWCFCGTGVNTGLPSTKLPGIQRSHVPWHSRHSLRVTADPTLCDDAKLKKTQNGLVALLSFVIQHGQNCNANRATATMHFQCRSAPLPGSCEGGGMTVNSLPVNKRTNRHVAIPAQSAGLPGADHHSRSAGQGKTGSVRTPIQS
ncbi:hypothetical protein B0T20DRAFT_394313 [Sordaria brevicollis]|uniref:Uncharacterized protein n=1 Tax=Sordaria brevicollis TaxID=83679 RepID=A0AAE0UB83_SORBR|nr:hypothetical protein B0T20DRAFT_394313 [Sordaria brevicollis]